MSFSNSHVRFTKFLGRFGVNDDKSTGEEASEWREKMRENVERINDSLKGVTDLARARQTQMFEFDRVCLILSLINPVWLLFEFEMLSLNMAYLI